MNTEEFTVLLSDIRWASMSRAKLSDKETAFVDDLIDMAAVYGRHMVVTQRQADWLAHIMEKIDGTSDA
jgi:hypothetical protein